MSPGGTFIEELKRRRVFRALVVYGAVAFAILQIVEPVMHGLRLPEWVLSVVVVVLGFGFPLTTGLAWVFDLKATGVERTPPAAVDGSPRHPRGTRLALLLLGLGFLVAAPGTAYHFLLGAGATPPRAQAPVPQDPLQGARFLRLTDFDGVAQAAALSRDGRFVAFESDRDGRMDVWVTQPGTGQFVNLTHGEAPEIVNPSVRTVGFSPDGTFVTFWARRSGDSDRPGIAIWSAPLLGGRPRPFLDDVAELDWTGDGARLAYHTPGEGDPLFVSESSQPSEARQIFAAPPGCHAHFPLWSPDQSFIYFVQGVLPDRMDIWRIRRTGGAPERITHHDSAVSAPVFLTPRTLVYLATDPDGFGPWMYALDVESGSSRRISTGVDSYTSLSASADGQRLVTTMAHPRHALWRVSLGSTSTATGAARRIPLTTGTGSYPRLGPGYLVYVSSKGSGDSLWRIQDGTATELWSAPDARIIGAPAIRRDGRKIAFSIRQGPHTLLYAMNDDGTGSRIVSRELELRGAPAWAPNGQSITVAAVSEGVPRLFDVPLDGRKPTALLAGPSLEPAWSPSGDIVAYSGADVGTTFPIRAAKADGSDFPLPPLTLTRGARHVAFLPEGRAFLALRGDLRHKDVWLVDVDTGVERQVTHLAPDFDVRDFDVSPDGSELVLEQAQERSDVVLIDLARR
jgi:Tol biopolymer transport system component